MDERLDRLVDEEEAEMEKALASKPTIPVAARVTLLERDVRGHSRSLSTLTNIVGDHRKALDEVEEWRMKALLEEVRREEQQKALNLKLDQMNNSFEKGLIEVKKQVGDMRSTWTRILWTIGSPVAVSMVIAVLGLAFGIKFPPT